MPGGEEQPSPLGAKRPKKYVAQIAEDRRSREQWFHAQRRTPSETLTPAGRCSKALYGQSCFGAASHIAVVRRLAYRALEASGQAVPDQTHCIYREGVPWDLHPIFEDINRHLQELDELTEGVRKGSRAYTDANRAKIADLARTIRRLVAHVEREVGELDSPKRK